ncbi:MAG: nitrophenyl compound nitroreductase subunit ArsF family protein [Candidatus Ratteibacteria bacterium]|nr:nitrophenyl compound nitroreductase subunit ArsF family protein [Candidatus Ratteibacteria bacterium]
MKNKLFFILMFSLIFLGTIYFLDELKADSLQANHISVYYFHGNVRCVTCNKFEKYAREIIETNFKDEIASGKVEFKVINVEDKSNEHYVDDYKLYTKSLVISLVKDGKEIKSKNLEKIWEYVRNKEQFFKYVTDEVTNLFKEL